MNTVDMKELEKPTRTVNFAKILLKPAEPPASGLLIGQAPPEVRLAVGARTRTPVLIKRRGPGRSAPLKPIEAKQFSVTRTKGTVSRALGGASLEPLGRAELSLPPGAPRFVNAATLKRMLRAKRTEVLLKRVGERWEVCENSLPIDLFDDSVEFRLGAVQIYS